MKKGISLIVLVITIIVLAILAGAIIISISNTNVMQKANEAVMASDLANAKYILTLEYAKAVSAHNDGKAYKTAPTLQANGTYKGGVVMTAADYVSALTSAGISGATAVANQTADQAHYYVTADANGVPSISLITATATASKN